MKGYLRYVRNNFKSGEYNLGIMIGVVLVGFILLFSLSFIEPCLFICVIIWLVIGVFTCISYDNYRSNNKY